MDGIVGRKTWISIHAPRAGSDSPSWARYPATMHFNPRSPCGERRAKYNQSINTGIFQSTLPVRGATSCRRTCLRTSLHFNPRSPCGERHDGGIDYALNDRISIHAPRAGSDAEAGLILTQVRKFQSTLPVRGATATRLWNRTRWRSFQSTLPVRGATTMRMTKARSARQFQSTLPVRGATRLTGPGCRRSPISIHAPRAGSDLPRESSMFNDQDFNPRSPCGERLGRVHFAGQPAPISIHAPRAGSDRGRICTARFCRYHFNPRSPCGERPWVRVARLAGVSISIHAPRAGSDGIIRTERHTGR